MKTTLKATLLLALLAFAPYANAQTDSARIVYVDLEKIQENYGLQVELEDTLQTYYKQIQDELAKKQKSIEATAAQLKKQIDTKGAAIQAKMKKTPATGGYKTEAEYNRDMKAVSNLQDAAQTKMDKLQADYAALEQKRTEDYQRRQQTLIQVVGDSIKAFISDYNAIHHHDYILIKSAALYANPSLEVTDEVLAGLNKRYQESKQVATKPEAAAE